MLQNATLGDYDMPLPAFIAKHFDNSEYNNYWQKCLDIIASRFSGTDVESFLDVEDIYQGAIGTHIIDKDDYVPLSGNNDNEDYNDFESGGIQSLLNFVIRNF